MYIYYLKTNYIKLASNYHNEPSVTSKIFLIQHYNVHAIQRILY